MLSKRTSHHYTSEYLIILKSNHNKIINGIDFESIVIIHAKNKEKKYKSIKFRNSIYRKFQKVQRLKWYCIHIKK